MSDPNPIPLRVRVGNVGRFCRGWEMRGQRLSKAILPSATIDANLPKQAPARVLGTACNWPLPPAAACSAAERNGVRL